MLGCRFRRLTVHAAPLGTASSCREPCIRRRRNGCGLPAVLLQGRVEGPAEGASGGLSCLATERAERSCETRAAAALTLSCFSIWARNLAVSARSRGTLSSPIALRTAKSADSVGNFLLLFPRERGSGGRCTGACQKMKDPLQVQEEAPHLTFIFLAPYNHSRIEIETGSIIDSTIS